MLVPKEELKEYVLNSTWRRRFHCMILSHAVTGEEDETPLFTTRRSASTSFTDKRAEGTRDRRAEGARGTRTRWRVPRIVMRREQVHRRCASTVACGCLGVKDRADEEPAEGFAACMDGKSDG
ncbi:unnamed protein product, partial [Mesorhabditis spiculigera]